MTNKPMLSVDAQHVVCSNGILCQNSKCAECGGNGSYKYQYAGMTQDQAQAVSDGIDEILHGNPASLYPRCSILKECNVKSSPASGARINSIAKTITRRVCHVCVGLPREVFCPVCDEEHPEPAVTIANLIQAAHEVRGFPAVKGYLLRELADRLNGVKP